ncbi:MAG: 3-phosphoshikimate 1-carboxyvinyltransferase [Chlamydiae bacterium]|nr:3-phosphoshikimate 1-carboxyvinyltransferase [Chlamydiota bacterium]
MKVSPSRGLQGEVWIPPSKSHTLRALVFAALAQGESQIEAYLDSPDTQAMIEALKLLGVQIQVEPKKLIVQGLEGRFCPPEDVIDCGNSGQVLRFVGALASLMESYVIFTGDHSIRHQRPVQPLLQALQQLGAFAVSGRGDGRAPIIIKGPIVGGCCELEGGDSQPVSGLLIAAAFAPHPVEIHVNNPGETPWIEVTLSWLKKFGIPYERRGYTRYRLEGRASVKGFHYKVPGDFSTAAFPIASALLTKSELTLCNLDKEDVQGDKELVFLLEKMGACFSWQEEERKLHIKKSPHLEGRAIDINAMIDALPILTVLACFAKSKTTLYNAAIARAKESDRIHAIAEELKKMGACIEEFHEGLEIYPSPLQGSRLCSYKDHRIALSLVVAAMAAEKGDSVIEDVACIKKTYPGFFETFQRLGMQAQLIEK